MRHDRNLALVLAITGMAAVISASALAMPFAPPPSSSFVDAMQPVAMAHCLPPRRWQKVCVPIPAPAPRPPSKCRYTWVCR